MKRLIILAVTASVALAACSAGSPQANNSPIPGTPGSSGTGAIGNPAKPVTLNESGSSLLYPFLQELVAPLHQKYPNITLAPAPGGSGKGISDAISGTVQLGGSDAYLSPGQLAANKGLLNIPIAVSAQAINFNLAGITSLKLSGNILAQMYEGKITKWNDSAISALNPGVTIPPTPVVPVRRVDSSGDTFIFTSLLTATNPAWNNGPAFGTTVTWPPVPTEVTANGNPGMVQTCKATPGCVAYVGVSSESAAQTASLGEAMLQNKAGNFVLPTADTINAAVSAGAAGVPASLAAPLIYESGSQSYPIVNFEYLVVKSTQPDAPTAQAIRTFLSFAIDPNGGSTPQYLSKEGFVALPSSVASKVQKAIGAISG